MIIVPLWAMQLVFSSPWQVSDLGTSRGVWKFPRSHPQRTFSFIQTTDIIQQYNTIDFCLVCHLLPINMGMYRLSHVHLIEKTGNVATSNFLTSGVQSIFKSTLAKITRSRLLLKQRKKRVLAI